MKRNLKKSSVTVIFFALLAIVALFLMGADTARPHYSDLHTTALQLTAESSEHIRSNGRKTAFQHPGAILRANVIKITPGTR